jgi:HSP20 family protein
MDLQVQVNKDRELSISGERQQRSSSPGAASSSSSSSSSSSAEVDVEGAEGSNTAQKIQRKRQERRFGTFKRTWNLPEDADVSQIKATVDQGVLSLTINRVQPAEPEVTNIPIS